LVSARTGIQIRRRPREQIRAAPRSLASAAWTAANRRNRETDRGIPTLDEERRDGARRLRFV